LALRADPAEFLIAVQLAEFPFFENIALEITDNCEIIGMHIRALY
jgi:hypothetical protein